ncbi:MAG: FAD-binding protein, partial [Mycobacterium sp.]|nr:FAD-binding protein [Mycobacterium sp.]
MTGRWDHSVDLLIAGSGGGGMVAALAALDAGLQPLIVEKQALVGGSTGMSGGMVWLPNNPLMRMDGIADSHEEGLAYFADVVGDIGAASSPARREMFLTAGSEMINFLLRKGVRLVRCPGWSDYYPNHKGGNAAGRAVEGIPFDAAELGNWSERVQPSLGKNYGGYVVKTNELRSVQYYNRTPRAFTVAMRVFLRTAAARIRR